MRVVLFVTLVILGGCLGGPEGATEATLDPDQRSRVAPPGAPTGFSADLGSIEGTVLSTEALPIAGANVSIFDPFELVAVTDSEGRFAFEQLEPGAYSVFAVAMGYEGQARRIEVTAETASPLRFMLEAMPILEPSSASFIDDGFLTLQLVAPGTPAVNPGGLLTLVPGASRDVWSFHHASEPSLAGYAGGLVWTANQFFSARNMTLHANSTHGRADSFLQLARGPSPVLLTVGLPNMTTAKTTVTSQFYLVNECGTASTGCSGRPLERWQQVVFQQRFQVYSTLFYVEPAPLDYSPVPDG